MAKNVLLISDDILKDRTAVHGNIDPKLLYPEIKDAQNMYILPILGTALYNKIINDVDSGTIAGDYKDLLDDYIIDPLLNYVLATLPTAISYQFWNKGVLRKSGDNTELPNMSELMSISDNYRRKAEWYADRLNKYLKAQADETFLPEYVNPGDEFDTIVPEDTSYTMPIYLGGEIEQSMDKNNCRE